MVAETYIIYLGYLGMILLIGLLCSIIASWIKIPNYLLLILVGIGLSEIFYYTTDKAPFSDLFITSIATLALAMIVFDASSRLKLREFDSLSMTALALAIIFFILNSAVLSAVAYYYFNVDSLYLSLLFATIVSGTAPSVILSLTKDNKSKIFELLEVESLINTPLIVLFPFLILDLMTQNIIVSSLGSHIIPFAKQFIVAIGTGVLAGLVFFKFMRKHYSEIFSPIGVITAAILTYVIAEQLDGNGVLAVTTAGLFFGNILVEGKRKLQEFSFTISMLLEILVFVLIGFVIRIPWTAGLFIGAAVLFMISILVRFICINIVFASSDYNIKEKLFLSINIPKGIAVAVVILTLATTAIKGILPILELLLVFMIYSIIASTIATHFSKYFTKVEAIK